MFKSNQKTFIILHDCFMTLIAWQLSWWLRFNFDFPYFNWELSLYSLPLVLIVQSLVYQRFKLYKGIWRFASIPDLWNIFRASVIGVLSIILVFFISIRLEGIPRSILVLYPILLMFLLGGPRLTYRMWKDHSLKINAGKQRRSVLVVGAGAAADILVRDMLREGSLLPVALVDDNPKLKGFEIHGVEVVGNAFDIPIICKTQNIELIIIAIPSATNKQMQSIIGVCEETGCPMRTLPSLQDMASGKVALNDLREVLIEDLLGRGKVNLDWDPIAKGIKNKCVLVTGGGGSIGKELCKQISKLSPSELIVLDHSEFNLYRIDKYLGFNNSNFKTVLGNVCDKSLVDDLLAQYKPHVIFHAAAYKHVPILEKQPREAVLNNILGTKVIADFAGKHKCERFVLISTDKAVNPSNILGATKRAAEMYVESLNSHSETKYMTVRFGNVLDSEGSVVPLFREQIKRGGPVTVTHPDITRYFMTIPESCQLIMQACAMGNGGEIFVLDMGEPVRINFLAEQMILLSGLVPGKDIEISYSGLRPGEKMYEELFYDSECTTGTKHKKIFIATYSILNSKEIDSMINEIIDVANNKNLNDLIVTLKKLVPYNNDRKDNIIILNKTKRL